MLAIVRDSVLEAVEGGRLGPDSAEDVSDVAHEIADGAPDVYTHTRWKKFVDLSAYQEEPEMCDAWPSDLTEAAGVALYQIAYRLVVALVTELQAEDEDDAPCECGVSHTRGEHGYAGGDDE